jgi:hypothetical protein
MNLPLLLDTCALVWIAGLAGDQHLGPVEEALDQARAAGGAAFLSPMTAWELGMLAAKGRLSFPMPIKAWLDQVVTTGHETHSTDFPGRRLGLCRTDAAVARGRQGRRRRARAAQKRLGGAARWPSASRWSRPVSPG